MDIQAIIARVEAIAASGLAEVEKVIHDALDTVEQVLGLDDSGDDESKPQAADCDPDNPQQDVTLTADAGNVASVTNAPDVGTDTVTPAVEAASGDAGNVAPVADVPVSGDASATTVSTQ